jgi:methyl-accepting chemotaxis protein
VRLRNLRVGPRLGITFGTILLLLVVMAAFGVRGLGKLRNITHDVAVSGWGRSQAAHDLRDAVNAGARAKLTMFSLTDAERIKSSADAVADARRQINAAYAVLDSVITDSVSKEILTRVKAARKVHAEAFDRAADVRKNGQTAESEQLLRSDVLPSLDAYLAAIAELLEYQDARVEVGRAAAVATAASGRRFIIILAIVAVILASVFARTVTLSITTPLRQMREGIEELARGNIDRTIQGTTHDEVSDVARSLALVLDAQKQMAVVARNLAAGNASVEVKARSERDVVSHSLEQCRESIALLVREMGKLVASASAGRLAERGDETKFQGAFRELVRGMNDTLDAVTTPINEAATVLQRVASRDVTARMEGTYRGEYAKIKDALNTAVANLDEALAQVSASSDQVAAASQQISSGSTELASGASAQSGAIQEVTASLQQLAGSARHSAESANTARAMSTAAKGSTAQGVESIERLSDAMSRIKASSDSTARIVKTIDEIAFQTNLLALNAAVEAARAGDAGRGFGIVAEEVRNLAMRTAEAARTTAQLIQESAKNAESGVSLNAEALARLADINQQVNRVGEVMAEVADTSEQQSRSVAQISDSMRRLSDLTQNAAASAQESSSAAIELSSQAAQLQEMVTSFALTHGERQERQPRQPRRTRGMALVG